MKLRCVLVAALLFASAAQAAEWREVGEVEDTGTIVSVDDKSLSVDHDQIVTGWVKFEYVKPSEREGYKVISYASRRMVDCSVNRYWVTDAWGYLPNNAEPVRLYSTVQEWLMPAPDSEAEFANAALCFETASILGWGKDRYVIFARLYSVLGILKGLAR
jgi:hypothetical protein